jgi:hypothetical protein
LHPFEVQTSDGHLNVRQDASGLRNYPLRLPLAVYHHYGTYSLAPFPAFNLRPTNQQP